MHAHFNLCRPVIQRKFDVFIGVIVIQLRYI